jgi:hypothetical protein
MLAPTADWLRQRLAGPRQLQAVEEDAVPQGLTSAAVLVPVIERPEGLTVLFTQRTAHLNDHAGQVSFPGGRCEEPTPRRYLRHCAKPRRRSASIRPLSRCSACCPNTAPAPASASRRWSAWCGRLSNSASDSFEVAEVFETPLAFLLDPANHQRHSMEIGGIVRHYYAMPYEGYFIWGATAGMLVSLHRLLYGRVMR